VSELPSGTVTFLFTEAVFEAERLAVTVLD
jgi:hypothetical protein